MHTIRLRHPWASEVLPDGRIRYVRKFHRPTGLTTECVLLNLHCVPPWSCAGILLNGESLAVAGGDVLQIDVTGQLELFNTLECHFAFPADATPTREPLFEQLAAAQLQIQDG